MYHFLMILQLVFIQKSTGKQTISIGDNGKINCFVFGRLTFLYTFRNQTILYVPASDADESIPLH